MNTLFVQRLQRILLVTGVLLIIATVLLFGAAITGLMHLPEKLFAGESAEHSIARVAIIGCLLAAIGTMEH